MVRSLTLVSCSALLALGCTLDLTGLDSDAGRADAAGRDGGADAGRSDAGGVDGGMDVCAHRGRSREVLGLSAAELGAGTRVGLALDDGALSLPLAPYHRGVALTGVDSLALNTSDPRVSDVDAAPARLTAIEPLLERDWGLGEGRGLGVGLDGWSLRAHGEIYLSEGSQVFELYGDDIAVFELDLDGTVERVSAEWPFEETLTVTVPRTGWYPFALAMQDSLGGAEFSVRLADGAGGFRPIGPSELRVDMSAFEGRQIATWALEVPNAFPAGLRVDADPTDIDFRNDYPESGGIRSASDWSARWVGIHQIGASGEQLEADVEKRFFGFVDGVFRFGGRADDDARLFGQGPHELVFEVQQDGGNDGRYRLTHASTVFEPAQMRPQARSGGRVFTRGVRANITVASGATETRALTLRAPNRSARFVEVSAEIDEVHEPSQVRLRWDDPRGGGHDFTLASSARRLPGSDTFLHRAVIDTIDDPSGEWDLTVTSDERTDVRWAGVGVMAHTNGVRDPYPESGEWTSAPLALGDDLSIDRVALLASVPTGGQIVIEVRAADTIDGLADATPIPATGDGSFGTRPRGRFMQLTLRLRGDRTTTPRVWGARVHARECVTCDVPATDRCAPYTRSDIEALYTFEEQLSGRWPDSSGRAPPANLALAQPSEQTPTVSGVRWEGDIVATTEGDTADRVTSACAASGDATLEAWLVPHSSTPVQGRRAAVASLSTAADDRLLSLTLRDNASVEGLVRTSAGVFTVFAPDGQFEAGDLVHLAVVRDATAATVALYVNGQLAEMVTAQGDLSDWIDGYRVHVGNEAELGEHLLGTLRRVAIYSGALSPAEITELYDVGPEGGR